MKSRKQLPFYQFITDHPYIAFSSLAALLGSMMIVCNSFSGDDDDNSKALSANDTLALTTRLKPAFAMPIAAICKLLNDKFVSSKKWELSEDNNEPTIIKVCFDKRPIVNEFERGEWKRGFTLNDGATQLNLQTAQYQMTKLHPSVQGIVREFISEFNSIQNNSYKIPKLLLQEAEPKDLKSNDNLVVVSGCGKYHQEMAMSGVTLPPSTMLPDAFKLRLVCLPDDYETALLAEGWEFKQYAEKYVINLIGHELIGHAVMGIDPHIQDVPELKKATLSLTSSEHNDDCFGKYCQSLLGYHSHVNSRFIEEKNSLQQQGESTWPSYQKVSTKIGLIDEIILDITYNKGRRLCNPQAEPLTTNKDVQTK